MSNSSISATISVNAPPIQVLEAFTNPDMLKDWWHVERCLIDKEDAGLYLLSWKMNQEGFGYVLTGIIEHYEEGKALEIRRMAYFNSNYPIFGPMRLSLNVEATNEGTLLILDQTGFKEGEHWEWYFSLMQKAWPKVLNDVKQYLESLS